ncbi:unnamed protein product [Oppiella nova]|uniref:Ketoreductase domain-containing protein n=1 Tax=Oppiella nova TaxID=334625 RepID=A0A7R9QRJ0_9ACAR|nr:unnamed protein product [Oppiella nova]CAG2171704.1 unnamed protein product [Oppiella nova]
MSIVYNFEGKVVLITGSSSGIGAATALLFARNGARVVITGLDGRDVRSVADECASVSLIGLSAILEVVVDVRRESDIRGLVAETINRFGRIDVLVNCAGILDLTPITHPDYIKNQLNVLDVNLNPCVLLTHLCAKYLKLSAGSIVIISSVASIQPAKNHSAYCMSKAALNMFTKCMAIELADHGVRVNASWFGAHKML